MTLALLIGVVWLTFVKATPMIYAALGGTLSERSGVINIGLEGMMTAGAFSAAVATYYTGQPLFGLLIGIIGGAIVGWLLGFLATRFKVDQIVAGTGLNILCLGGAAYGLMLLFNQPGASPQVHSMGENYRYLVWLAPVAAVGMQWFLSATPWGLRIRACGENPKAVAAAGLNPLALRVMAVTMSGAFAGFAGAFLSVGELNLYSDGMTAGRGFIALAAIIFGRWNPLGAFAACLLFGLLQALQIQLQGHISWLPTDVFEALPYVAALIALVGAAGRKAAPVADGVPY